VATSRQDVLILAPVYAREEVPTRNIELLHELEEIGEVWVLLQVAQPNFTIGRGRIIHYSQPLDTWGALHQIYPEVLEYINREPRIVVHHQSLYFAQDTVARLVELFQETGISHVVACRQDLVSSLHQDPAVGLARALMECFLTAIASITLTGKADMTPDGFTGLQAFSPERYRLWNWDWISKTKWGGALESQVQSVERGFGLTFLPVPHQQDRDWSSSLGADRRAVVQMLDKARHLPILQNPSPEVVGRAFEEFPTAFAEQPWPNPSGTAGEVRMLLSFYNEQTEFEPYLLDTTG